MRDTINGVIRTVIRKGWRDNAFNQFVSDLIPIDRRLPDLRDKGYVYSAFPYLLGKYIFIT